MASVIILYDLLHKHPMALLYNVHYSHLCACIYVFIYCICFLWDLRLQLVVRLLLLMHTKWDKSKLDKDICEHMSIWVQMSKFSVEMRVNAERLWVEETKMKKTNVKMKSGQAEGKSMHADVQPNHWTVFYCHTWLHLLSITHVIFFFCKT